MVTFEYYIWIWSFTYSVFNKKRHFTKLTILFSIVQVSKQNFNKSNLIILIYITQTLFLLVHYIELGPKAADNEQTMVAGVSPSYSINLLNGVKSLACTKSGVSRIQ